MSADEEITPQQFAEAFQRLTEWSVGEGRHGRSPFKERLTEHFGEDPATYPLMTETIAVYDLPNLQLALDAYLGAEGREHSLTGFGGPVDHMEISLAGLVHDFGFGLAEGPVRRTVVPLEQDRTVTCVTIGLFLISEGQDRLAALVIQGRHGFENAGLRVEVIAPEQAAGERFVTDIRTLMHTHNVFRGKVLTLKAGDEMMGRGMAVEFPAVESVGRDQIVLPEGVLDVVELHTIEFSRHAEALRDAGRHLRRGLLLHGPPGTGKTLSTSYLISQLEGRTVVILTGTALVLVSDACTIARELQPAMVVLEDVDLVAQERTAMGFGATTLLFRLLNEMDGIGEDADVIFVMTTNRADLLEPALAARPGRVDQAVAFPLPDADARSRLLELFGRGLDIHLTDRAAIVAETEGVSPAFLRELVRKAALHAARAESPRVEDAHFREALDLLERGGAITRSMLGAGGGAVERLDAEDAWGEAEWDEE
jgi:ATPase family associated with various cellular activities (AAA)/AAA+ lid domain